MDRISELPQGILQRILYFLSQEEAVRTSVLSKSWRYIWCTRPNLDFSEDAFEGYKRMFLSVVDNTLQRYSDQRLCLEEFHLCVDECWGRESVSLLEKWIPLLTTMGVVEFHLSILSDRNVRGIIDLPAIVFKAESLKLLCLHKCNLGRNTPDNISFVRLQVLRFSYVSIEKEIFDKIISSCPLLTTMFFEGCKLLNGLKTIKLDKKLHKYLKHFTFISSIQCSIEIDVPSIETIEIYGSKIRFHGHKFGNLKSLSLTKVEISSNSTEESQPLFIDAPNISYFEYTGDFIPSISFTATSREWRSSNIHLLIRHVDDALSWFLDLSKLIQTLRQSEISLDIFEFSRDNIMQIQQDILVQDIIDGGSKPVLVDQLRLNCSDSYASPSFLNGLFCVCRPRKIIHKLLRGGGLTKERELIEYFCNIRERGNHHEIIWQDLEGLSIEGFDKSRQEWQTLYGTTLSESALPDFDSFRVRLKWSGDQASESSFKLSESYCWSIVS